MLFVEIDCSDFFVDSRERTLVPLRSSSTTIQDVLQLLQKSIDFDTFDLGLTIHSKTDSNSRSFFLLKETEVQALEFFVKNEILSLKLVRLENNGRNIHNSSQPVVPSSKENRGAISGSPARKKLRAHENHDCIGHGTDAAAILNCGSDKDVQRTEIMIREPSDSRKDEGTSSQSKVCAIVNQYETSSNSVVELTEEKLESKSLLVVSVHSESCVEDLNASSWKDESDAAVANMTVDLLTADGSVDMDESAVVTRIHHKRKRRHKKKKRENVAEIAPLPIPVAQPRYEQHHQAKHMFFESGDSSSETEEHIPDTVAEPKATSKDGLLPKGVKSSDSNMDDLSRVPSSVGMDGIRSPGPVSTRSIVKIPNKPMQKPATAPWTSTPQATPDLSALLALKNSPVPKVFKKKEIYANKSVVVQNRITNPSVPVAVSPKTGNEPEAKDAGRQNGLLKEMKTPKSTSTAMQNDEIFCDPMTKELKERVPDKSAFDIDKGFVSHEIDYTKFPSVVMPPLEGSVIAFRKLELDGNYCPVLSDYQRALVVSSNDGKLILRRLDPKPKKLRSGKFDIDFFNESVETPREGSDEECNFAELMSPVILKLGQPE